MVPYYMHEGTGELTWNTPDDLRSNADRAADGGSSLF